MTEASIPSVISQGRPFNVSAPIAATTTSGPMPKPSSPPTMKKPIPRPTLLPAFAPTIAGAIEWKPAVLKPASTSSSAVSPKVGATPTRLIRIPDRVGARMTSIFKFLRSAR